MNIRAIAILALAASMGASAPAFGQSSTVSPSSDWNGNYGFTSSADRNLRLVRSDLIKKAEEGYYESLGRNTTYVTNNSTTTIGQQTTAIGAVNNSTTNIDISNSTNIDVSTQSTSNSNGCQDAHVNVDNSGVEPSQFNCN